MRLAATHAATRGRRVVDAVLRARRRQLDLRHEPAAAPLPRRARGHAAHARRAGRRSSSTGRLLLGLPTDIWPALVGAYTRPVPAIELGAGRQALRRDHRGGRARPRGAAGICLGLLGPNGAGKSTTMRLLTGQAIADAGELRVLGHELPGEAKEARAEMGVVPQLDNLDIDVTVEDNLAVFARLYRVADVRAAVDRGLELARLQRPPRGRGRQALGRDAPPAAARARARARPAADAARRADRRPRPADPHRALVADRRAARAGARRS